MILDFFPVFIDFLYIRTVEIRRKEQIFYLFTKKIQFSLSWHENCYILCEDEKSSENVVFTKILKNYHLEVLL